MAKKKTPQRVAAKKEKPKKPAPTNGIPARELQPLPVKPDSMLIKIDIRKESRPDWFVRQLIPVGGLTFLEGDPGTGKTAVALDLIARASTSTPADLVKGFQVNYGSCRALYLSTENDVESTLAPRLRVAGAKEGSVLTLPRSLMRKSEWRLPELVPRLREIVHNEGLKIIVLDPWVSYLAPGLSPYSEPDVRCALEPLGEMADEEKILIICIRHPTKARGGRAIYRGAGSLGISAVARVILWTEEDRKNPGKFVLSQSKNSMGPVSASISYHLKSALGSVLVDYLGEIDQTASDPISAAEEAARFSLFEQACRLVKEALSGGEKPAKEILAEARVNGISESTLHAAKSAMGVTSDRKDSASDGHFWAWVPPAKWPDDERRKV